MWWRSNLRLPSPDTAASSYSPLQDDTSEPMELGSSCISAQEGQCHMSNGLCLYCGATGHFRAHCSLCKISPHLFKCSHQFCLPATLFCSNLSMSMSPLIDSGSAGNFVSQFVVSMLSIPVLKLMIAIKALDGRPLLQSLVTYITALVHLVFPDHSEKIRLFVLTSSQPSFVLGLPWLQTHNPQLDWWTTKIVSWSPTCIDHLLNIRVTPKFHLGGENTHSF